jgi:GGDEF domain-containing protein
MSTHPPMKQESNTVDSFSEAQEPTHALYDWRSSVLDIFLPLASLAFLPSIVQTVLQVINDPQVAWQGAAIIVFFYLILVFVTFTPRRISTTMRSWVVVALTYLTGIVSMARGGLAGDGTLFLTVLPILTITLVNAHAGIYAAGVSISTFILFGILAHAGILNPWLIIHDNPQTPDQWLYFGLAMSTLIIVTVFVVIRFSNFQLETLKAVQEMAKALADSHQQLELANRKLEQKVQERTAELSDANQHLQFLATHDNLTGLPNRFLFFDRLGQAIKKSRRQKRRFALLFIDLDDFKRINDSFGHMIILDDIREVSDIEAIARKINLAVSQPIDVPQETVIMTVSIGISLFPEHGEDAETLLRKADEAMYYVKNGTQNSYHIHSE